MLPERSEAIIIRRSGQWIGRPIIACDRFDLTASSTVMAGPEIGGGNFLSDTCPEEKAAELRAVPALHYKEPSES